MERASLNAAELLSRHAGALKKIAEKNQSGRELSESEIRFLESLPETSMATATLAAAAARLGIEPAALRQAKKEGAPGFAASSRVYLDQLIPWLIRWLWEKTKAGKISRDDQIKDLKIARLQHQLDAERERRRPNEEWEQACAELASSFSLALDNAAPTLAADVVGCGNIAETEKRIRAAHESIKRSLHTALTAPAKKCSPLSLPALPPPLP